MVNVEQRGFVSNPDKIGQLGSQFWKGREKA
jgi:hypothetical protein